MSLAELFKKAHSVTAMLVYAGDAFTIDVEAKKLRHTPDLHHVHPYQDVIGAYAYAIDASGTIVAMVYADKKALDAAAKFRLVWSQYPKVCARNHVVELLNEKMKEQGIPL